MKSASLDEVCEINVGRTPARAEPTFWGPGHPWLSIADMNQGLAITTTKEQITDAGARGGKVVAPGTVLLSFKLSIGKVGIAQMPLYTNEAIAALPVKDAGTLDPRFLMRSLEAMDLAGGSNRAAMGATLNKKSLAQIRVPLPPLPEQRRIAAILDHADLLRAKRRQVLAHLDSLPQSIFHDMFGNVARQHSWPVVKLGEVAESRLGKMLNRKRQTGLEARPYLRNANVQWFSFDLTDVLTMDFDEKDRAELLLRRGDVLVCEGGRPGRSAIWREELGECYFQKALHRVRCGEDLDPEYFVQFMWVAVHGGALKDFVTSATIAHLTGEKLRTLPVALPSISLQKDFAARVAEIRRNRATLLEATAANNHLFAALQSHAFRGEL